MTDKSCYTLCGVIALCGAEIAYSMPLYGIAFVFFIFSIVKGNKNHDPLHCLATHHGSDLRCCG